MGKFLRKFCRDERGCVPAHEWIFVASILTLGTIAGMLAMRHFEDIAAPENWPRMNTDKHR